MSGWSNNPNTRSNDTGQRKSTGRPRKATRTIKPFVSFARPESCERIDGEPSKFDKYVDKLRANEGSAFKHVQHHLDGSKLITGVTPVYHADGLTPAYLELRCEVPRVKATDTGKTYRVIFRGSITDSEDPRDNKDEAPCAGFELSKYGLYIPTNAKGLIDGQKYAKDQKLKLLCVWTEGDKTAKAVQELFETEELTAHCTAEKLHPVVSATLGGVSGVKHTNYRLIPPGTVDPDYTLPGVNDWKLNLEHARHYIVLDADEEGSREGNALAAKLQLEYGVDTFDIFFIDPPKGVPVGWDDADLLPHDVSLESRLNQYINPRRQIDWSWRTVKGNPEINHQSVPNRMKALTEAGVTAAYTDTATETTRYVSEQVPFTAGREPSDDEVYDLACLALQHMGKHPEISDMTHWREPLVRMAMSSLRDLIKEETERTIDHGRPLMNPDNSPEMLFIKAFGLEDNPFNRAAGWHLIRDMLALRLRPALRGDGLYPQLFFVLYGNEGSGKSTFCRVLAGGSPASAENSARYTDSIDFKDLDGSGTHANLQLVNKVRGCVVAEFPDKTLGHGIGQTRAGVLKNAVNKGVLEYRRMRETSTLQYRCRHVYLFTTNSMDIINEDMGSRRWVIIDTTKTKTPTAEEVRLKIGSAKPDPIQKMILEGKNPNLNWLQDNLPAMFAHMFEQEAWKGELNAKPEFLDLMKNIQVDYVQNENWEDVFTGDMEKIQHVKNIALTPYWLGHYVKDTFRSEQPPARSYGALLRRLGWEYGVRRIGEKLTRVWHRSKNVKDVDTYAQWELSSTGVLGKWRTAKNPDETHTMILSAASKTINDDKPF